jgi:hypothetical protein
MSSPYGYAPTSPSLPGQAMNGLVLILILFILFYTADIIYRTTYDMTTRYRSLINYTADSDDVTLTIHQDKNRYPDAIPIGFSANERTGIEFAYSFYLYVKSSTFSSGQDTLKHVFHKGYGLPNPLMGPGVFLKGNTNTMRVFMNTYSNPYTFVDVKNIPVEKWFHVVLNCYNGGLDVFVNGYMANRLTFENTMPYQNFGDVTIFSTVKKTIPAATNPPLAAAMTDQAQKDLAFDSTMNGKISNLVYARYALSMSEIQKLLTTGPSSTVKTPIDQKPPYLADDWWTMQH